MFQVLKFLSFITRPISGIPTVGMAVAVAVAVAFFFLFFYLLSLSFIVMIVLYFVWSVSKGKIFMDGRRGAEMRRNLVETHLGTDEIQTNASKKAKKSQKPPLS